MNLPIEFYFQIEWLKKNARMKVQEWSSSSSRRTKLISSCFKLWLLCWARHRPGRWSHRTRVGSTPQPRIAARFQHLGQQIFQHGGQVDRSTCHDTSSVVVLTQVAIDRLEMEVQLELIDFWLLSPWLSLTSSEHDWLTKLAPHAHKCTNATQNVRTEYETVVHYIENWTRNWNVEINCASNWFNYRLTTHTKSRNGRSRQQQN